MYNDSSFFLPTTTMFKRILFDCFDEILHLVRLYPKSKLPKLFTNWPCERLRCKIHHGGRNTGWNHRMPIIYIFRNNKTFQNYTNFASILQFIITKIERHACIINLKLKIKKFGLGPDRFSLSNAIVSTLQVECRENQSSWCGFRDLPFLALFRW